MAAQPKKKISRVRGRTRRAHQARKLPQVSACANCQAPKPAHIVCPECGFYAGRKTITTAADKRIQAKLGGKPKTETKPPAEENTTPPASGPDMEKEPPKKTEGKPANAKKRAPQTKSKTQAKSDKAHGSDQS